MSKKKTLEKTRVNGGSTILRNNNEKSKKESKIKDKDEEINNFVEKYNKTVCYVNILRNKHIFNTIDNNYIEELCDIAYISINMLYKIEREIASTHNPLIGIKKLKSSPQYFISETYTLISLKAFESLIKCYNLENNPEIKEAQAKIFIYHYFMNDAGAHFIPKYKKIQEHYDNFESISKKCKMKDKVTIKRFDRKTKKDVVAIHYIYDELEFKYKEYREIWDLKEWNPKELDLIITTDFYRATKEENGKPSRFWSVPHGQYYSTKRFLDFNEELTQQIVNFNEKTPNKYTKKEIDDGIMDWEKYSEKKLNSEQKYFIHIYFTSSLNCLTGYPGTGKSTVVDAVVYVDIYLKLKEDEEYEEDEEDEEEKERGKDKEINNMLIPKIPIYMVLAPTGKAIKNIEKKFSEKYKVNIKCFNLHKFLFNIYPEFNKKKNDEDFNPDPESMGDIDKLIDFYRINRHKYIFKNLIIDEASMVDIYIFTPLKI
jgi:hypothetical protein